MTDQSTTDATGAPADGGVTGTPATPGQLPAEAEIDAIRTAAAADPKHPYNDPKHPEHQALHQRVAELYEQREAATAEPGAAQPAGEDDLREVFEGIHIRDEAADLDSAAQEFDEARGWLGEAQATRGEAAEMVAAYNELARLPDAQLHNPVRVQRAHEGCIRALQALWGDAYDDKLAAANRAVAKLDGEAGRFGKFLHDTYLGDDPRVARLLADIAERRGW